MRQTRPLWGFGWTGWLLLLVAAPLAWAYFTGYDLRYDLMRAINNTLGSQAMLWFCTVWLVWHHLLALDPLLGPVTLCYILVAMHLHPRRRRWWYVALGAWAFMRPPLQIMLSVHGRPLGLWWSGAVVGGTWQPGWGLPIAMALLCAADALVLWLLTRSVLVIIPAIIAGLANTVLFVVATMFDPYHWSTSILHTTYTRILWHGGMGAALLWWAIRARRNLREPYQCQPCGYDLRGIADSQACPECGAARVPSPT